jgi:hypothetical protein
MDLAEAEKQTLEKLRTAGRSGATAFAAACVERLRPLLAHVPSGAPPLVAGVALTQLWRVLEGADRPDPRRLGELSKSCWALVEIEPVPKIPTLYLELLVAGAHDALETYLSGDAQHAIAALRKSTQAAAQCRGEPAAEAARQERDIREITDHARARGPFPPFATQVRKRAEKEGAAFVQALLKSSPG